MLFGDVACSDAIDCILAHSTTAGNLRIRKGQRLTDDLIGELVAHGVKTVTVAKLEPGDIHEDTAAQQLAEALCGQGVYLGEARTGRVNVYAAVTGLLEVNRQSVIASNSIAHAITFATLGENLWVPLGKLVATAKIIPFAVAGTQLEAAIQTAKQAAGISEPALQVHRPIPRRAHLVQTILQGTRERVLEKTVQVCADRLAKRDATLASCTTCTHTSADLTQALKTLTASGNCRKGDWILIVGASAISDIKDVIPASIRQLGGRVDRFGIPVDPGNLLMSAELHGHPVIGLPGCARSPKHNGFDQFLDRMSCNLVIDDNWINNLAVGGLLNEIPERPQQRSKLTTASGRQAGKSVKNRRKIAAVVLAAGRSRRFGKDNKLLAMWQGKPILQHALENLAASKVDEIVLVTGHESERLRAVASKVAALLPLAPSTNSSHSATHNSDRRESAKTLSIVHNPDYSEGMASSLRTAISFLSSRMLDNRDHDTRSATLPLSIESNQGVEAVLVCLGDMPQIEPATINNLIDVWQEDTKASAFIPVFDGRQGNPVIITSGLFDNLLSLTGDSGARKLLHASPAIVTEVSVNDPAILMDVDTSEELDSLEPKS